MGKKKGKTRRVDLGKLNSNSVKSEPSEQKETAPPNKILTQRPLFIWMTLVISVFGGGPGVVKIYELLKQAPTFKFIPASALTATQYDPQNNKNRTIMIFAGLVVNKGTNPL